MTERERDEKFYVIADKGEQWQRLWDAVRNANHVYPQHVITYRKQMKPLEADILRIADEIKSADLAEAHRDACEDW